MPNISVLVGSGAAMGCYLFAQVAPSSVPDALGTTVLTVGGGGLALAAAAMVKDFFTYKRQQIESKERQAKEERESRERIEREKLGLERLRITQSKNNRLTNAMWNWMENCYKNQKFMPPPPRVSLPEEVKLDQ